MSFESLKVNANPTLAKLLSSASNLLNSNYALICFYTLFSLGVFFAAMSNPTYNWDIIGYVGSVRYFQIKDKVELHETVYSELRTFVNEDEYEGFTDIYYRKTTSIDPEAFYQQLPFYQIKILYVLLIMLFAKLGINIFSATYLISTLGSIFGLWVLLLSFKPYLSRYFLYLIPLFGFAFEILQIARGSTPDGLAFLTVCLIAYLLIKENRIIFIMLPLSILVRTDLIIFALMTDVFLSLNGKRFRALALVNIPICLLAFIAVNNYFGNYGWSLLFYHTYFEWLVYPAETKIAITPSLYIKGLYAGLQGLSLNAPFFTYITLALLSIILFVNRYSIKCLQNPVSLKIFYLFIASFIYITVHFILFPTIDSRFFLGQYMLTAIGFMYLLSYLENSNTLDAQQQKLKG